MRWGEEFLFDAMCGPRAGLRRLSIRQTFRIRGQTLFKALLIICLGLLDPFGAASGTKLLSQEIILRAYASWYPDQPSAVTVVLIDEAAVAAAASLDALPWADEPEAGHDAVYPIGYHAWSELLREIVCRGPHAVFIDVIFTKNRDAASFGELTDWLSRSGSKEEQECGGRRRTPVLLADELPQEGLEHVPFEGVLAEDLREVDLLRVPVNRRAAPNVYPLAVAVEVADSGTDTVADPGVHASLTRGLVDNCGGPLLADKQGTITFSPAVRLWTIATHPTRPRGDAQDAPENIFDCARQRRIVDTRHAALPIADMVVAWRFSPQHEIGFSGGEFASSGARLPPFRLQHDPSCAVLDSTLDRLKQFATDLALDFSVRLQSLMGMQRPIARQICPPVPTVSGALLLEDSLSPDRIQDFHFSQLFYDKYVLIGVDVVGIHDLASSAVHGRIPGVELHAMALDNLLRWGPEGVWRLPPQWSLLWIGQIGADDLVEMVVIIVYLHIVSISLRQSPGTQALLGGLSVILLVIFLNLAFRWPPLNWIGLISLIALFTEKLDLLERLSCKLAQCTASAMRGLRIHS